MSIQGRAVFAVGSSIAGADDLVRWHHKKSAEMTGEAAPGSRRTSTIGALVVTASASGALHADSASTKPMHGANVGLSPVLQSSNDTASGCAAARRYQTASEAASCNPRCNRSDNRTSRAPAAGRPRAPRWRSPRGLPTIGIVTCSQAHVVHQVLLSLLSLDSLVELHTIIHNARSGVKYYY
jgi:hypothetical protein